MALFPDSASNWPKSKNHTLLSLSEKLPASQSSTKCVCTGGEVEEESSDCAPKTLGIPGIVTACV